MTNLLTDAPARLGDLAGELNLALACWSARDDTRPQPEVRRAANRAMDAIDAALNLLHSARSELVTQIRRADDATAARVDAILAQHRTWRDGGAR